MRVSELDIFYLVMNISLQDLRFSQWCP